MSSCLEQPVCPFFLSESSSLGREQRRRLRLGQELLKYQHFLVATFLLSCSQPDRPLPGLVT